MLADWPSWAAGRWRMLRCCHSLVFVEVRAGSVCAGVSSLLLALEEGGGVPPLGHAPNGGQARFGDGLGLGPAELLKGLVTGRGGFCCLASVVLFDCSLPMPTRTRPSILEGGRGGEGGVGRLDEMAGPSMLAIASGGVGVGAVVALLEAP